MTNRAPSPPPCPSCSARGTVPQYTPGLPFGFSDALGPTVDAPCEACGGTGYQTCLACDAPATVRDEHGVWCEGCAALNAPATIPCPAPAACEAAS